MANMETKARGSSKAARTIRDHIDQEMRSSSRLSLAVIQQISMAGRELYAVEAIKNGTTFRLHEGLLDGMTVERLNALTEDVAESIMQDSVEFIGAVELQLAIEWDEQYAKYVGLPEVMAAQALKTEPVIIARTADYRTDGTSYDLYSDTVSREMPYRITHAAFVMKPSSFENRVVYGSLSPTAPTPLDVGHFGYQLRVFTNDEMAAWQRPLNLVEQATDIEMSAVYAVDDLRNQLANVAERATKALRALNNRVVNGHKVEVGEREDLIGLASMTMNNGTRTGRGRLMGVTYLTDGVGRDAMETDMATIELLAKAGHWKQEHARLMAMAREECPVEVELIGTGGDSYEDDAQANRTVL